MKGKGFTLIELLAVIVVLAIIALIATPLVMNTIKNVKKGATERSAENYIRGVETMIMEKRATGTIIEDGLYEVDSNGNLIKNGKTYPIEVQGNKPTSGSKIVIENGRVEHAASTTLTYPDYTVTYIDGKLVATLIGSNEIAASICILDGTEKDSSKYSAGDRYLCKVDPNKEAYGFYVLTTVDKTAKSVNMIAEANISPTGDLVKTDAQSTPDTKISWQASGNIEDGPITVMDYLKTATSNWTNTELQIITGWNDDKNQSNVGEFEKAYTVNARLPLYQEVSNASNSSTPYIFNYLHASDGGVATNGVVNMRGYWINSVYSSEEVYFVNFNDFVTSGPLPQIGAFYGVRPVITISRLKIA